MGDSLVHSNFAALCKLNLIDLVVVALLICLRQSRMALSRPPKLGNSGRPARSQTKGYVAMVEVVLTNNVWNVTSYDMYLTDGVSSSG